MMAASKGFMLWTVAELLSLKKKRRMAKGTSGMPEG